MLRFAFFCSIAALGLTLGCAPAADKSNDQGEVVVYTAHDSVFSEPIFEQFQESTGITVRPAFDVESTKTVGLVNRIMAESDRPRCDVFWNNEILNSLRLEEQGLLEAYVSPAAKSYPTAFRDAKGKWNGFAARARIILCNTKLVPEGERPNSIYDLADAKWKGKTAIAKPLFGTTATHAACLFAALGDEKAKEFFQSLKANEVQILAGNKQVAEAVANGGAAFGLTDTDDALQMIEQGLPVTIIYPDQEEGGLGTLFIPNTVSIIKGCAHPDEARKLVDYLLSADVETALAKGPAGQIPLNPKVDVETKVETPKTIKPMAVEFDAAAAKWDAAAKYIADEFTAGN
ncbi:MAG: extracellular solute-binding protein [Pirellulales bacterium]|nr:extracellular solute-binding protein [Pirellulales bacterium]